MPRASSSAPPRNSNAPPGSRVDQLILTSGRLRYVACPFKPFIGSRQRNVCDGK